MFVVLPGPDVKKQQNKRPRKHGGLSGTSSESESEESDKESCKDSDDSFKSVSSADEDDDFNPFRDESDDDEEDGEFSDGTPNMELKICNLQKPLFFRSVAHQEGAQEKEREKQKEEEEKHRSRFHPECPVGLWTGLHQTWFYRLRDP